MSKPENSESENFLTRWSSRKLANRTQAALQAEHAEHEAANEHGAVSEPPKEDGTHEKQPFDPAQLPPLDSIGPETDVAAFLRKEVPPDLTRAALRRAWTSDPAIKDFVGLVENGWDFNDPSATPGFGPITAEEVARLVGKVIEALPGAAPGDQTKEVSTAEKKFELASSQAAPAGSPEGTSKAADAARGSDHDAAQQNDDDDKA